MRAFTYHLDDTPAKETILNAVNPTSEVTYTWDPKFRRLVSLLDGTGTTSFSYHPFGTLGGGQLASVDGPLDADTVTMTYDELGRPGQQAIAGVARDFVYDAGSRITRETNPLGQFNYTYVGASRRVASITSPNGLNTVLSYLPNAQDRRLAILTHIGPGGSAVSSFAYGYDADGGITEWTQNQPANTLNPVSAWTIEQDAADQLTGVSVAGQPDAREAFSYDAAGNRLTAQSGNATTISTFNVLNQIQTVGGGGKIRFSGTTSEPANVTVQGLPARMSDATGFTADATVNAGNNTISVTATDGNANSRTNNYQVVIPSAATRTFFYDPNGNLLDDGERTYAWDGRNRLVRVRQGSDTYEWAYNGLDQRVSESKNGVLVKRWVWAGGGQPAEERNAAGAVMRRFYPQGEQAWGTNYYHTRDHLGSIREVLDAAGGVVSSYRYDAWGRRTLQTEEDVTTLGYTGHMENTEIGLVFTKYRAYDPETARWLSRDPIGEAGGINLYGYVSNNPVNFIDPTGEFAFAIPIIVTAPEWGPIVGGAAISGLAALGAWEIWDTLFNESQGEAGECPAPEEIEGKSEDEVGEVMGDKGWPGEPSREGGGTRYPNPNRRGEQVRTQPGNPNDPNPVKRGPYARISTGGKTSPPIPLRGNPTLNQ